MPLGIRHRQRDAIVFLETLQHFFAIVRRKNRNERRIIDIDHKLRRIREHERSESHVFEQMAFRIEDVNDVDRLLAATRSANVLERFRGRHVRLDRDVARRHVAAGRLLRISEKCARVVQFLG